MKRLIIGLTVCLFVITTLSVCFGQNFPAMQPPAARQPQPYIADKQIQMEYVPPPPIRHTWPGGYRVIFHELTNTLMEHILGQY